MCLTHPPPPPASIIRSTGPAVSRFADAVLGRPSGGGRFLKTALCVHDAGGLVVVKVRHQHRRLRRRPNNRTWLCVEMAVIRCLLPRYTTNEAKYRT